MDNDLEIFRRKEERKKKNKRPIVVDYPTHNDDRVCFLGKGKSGEALVFLTDGETTECISK